MSDRRLVVLRALGLGDLLVAVPALRALAEAFAGYERTLALPRALHPLAAHVGVADRLVAVPFGLGLAGGSGMAPSRLPDPLPNQLHRALVAVNLHGAGPQSSLALAATAPRRLLAHAHPDVAQTRDGPAWVDDLHETDRWCRLLRAYGIDADPTRLSITVPDVPAPSAANGATLLHPGAASAGRRWPARRWVEVARAQVAARHPVVLTGSHEERALALRIARAAGVSSDRVLAGRTDLLTLVATVAVARRVVCADTGVAHLATALGIPSVVLFGPVPPSRWGPPGDDGRHRVLWTGGTGDPHAPTPDPGLLRITVDDVLEAMGR